MKLTSTFSLLGFVAHLHAIEADMKDAGHAIVARACELIAAEAKRVLGEGYENWPALQAETLARKIGPGPLLETGELRDSIGWVAEGNRGQVGSNNDKAVWHELGTSRIPPRPFLAGAAQHMGPKIEKMAIKAVRAAMRGDGLRSAEMSELIHILKHVGHAAKEATDKILDGPEEEGKRR